MSRIKTIIVDDEQLARRRIKKLLEEDEEIHIVSEFNNGSEAIEFIKNHTVDILYLDIHMPEVDGFSVLEKIDEEFRPFVIFATADKESALKAFEYKALDYLLKPFRKGRFYESLKNAKEYVQLKNKAKLSDSFVNLIDDYKEVKRNKVDINKNQSIDFDDILYVRSDGNYLRLYTNKTEYTMIRKTMNDLMNGLDEKLFLRIHRSILINSYFIEKRIYLGNNEYEFILNPGISLKSSRSYKDHIDRFNF